MADVYLAHGTDGRRVALKVLKAPREDNEVVWRLFSSECAVLSAIEHHHVVRIFDHEVGGAVAYLAMEYIEGGTLRRAIRTGLHPDQAMSALRQAASALAVLHRRGIVHRDVKPENFLFRADGTLVLADFGLAAGLAGTVWPMYHGPVVGTPCYASPEQAQGGAVNAAADIYGLGIIFFEMLCDHRPFEGETLLEVQSQHLMAPIPRLPAKLAHYQPLIDGMLEKQAQCRLADGSALLDEIRRVECATL